MPTFFVARRKDRSGFACLGRETGMGRTLETSPTLQGAQRFGSPAAIMTALGGHYRGFEAIRVRQETINMVDDLPVPFPPESQVWPPEYDQGPT